MANSAGVIVMVVRPKGYCIPFSNHDLFVAWTLGGRLGTGLGSWLGTGLGSIRHLDPSCGFASVNTAKVEGLQLSCEESTFN